MASRPICDVWILARPKVKYYGAYPNGFLERAIPAIGASTHDTVIHACGGHARAYPNKKWVRNAVTLDIDPNTKPDFLGDVQTDDPWTHLRSKLKAPLRYVLIDPPYSAEDAKNYEHKECPKIGPIMEQAARFMIKGGTIGVLHYVWPRPPKGFRQVMLAAVVMGYYNKARFFSVFQKE